MAGRRNNRRVYLLPHFVILRQFPVETVDGVDGEAFPLDGALEDVVENSTATCVVVRRGRSAVQLFASEKGRALVSEQGWTDTYVCDIATQSCVLKMAVDAFELDLNPWLVENVSASHAGRTVHEAGVQVTQRFIGKGQIITIDGIPNILADQSRSN